MNDKFYIGSSKDFRKRFNEHFRFLKLNKHSNIHLQRAYNIDGLLNFIPVIIELCEKEKLIEREQFYLDTLKPEYNICKIAYSRVGTTFSEHGKRNVKAALNSMSEEAKKLRNSRMSASRMGQECPTRNKERWPHTSLCRCEECRKIFREYWRKRYWDKKAKENGYTFIPSA